jgi:hypothetical protein
VATAVEYVLDGPTDADLIESFPVFLVSDELGQALTAAGLDGFTLKEAEVVPSREYTEVYGDAPHKAYDWLRVTGDPDTDDVWVDKEHRLAVSDRMMEVLSRFSLEGSDISPI